MNAVKEVTTLEIVEIDEYEWTAMIDDIQEVEIDMEDIIQEVAQEAIPDRDRRAILATKVMNK
jgi:phage terminase large subunit-like protein